MTYLSAIPIERPHRIEWYFLFLENLNEFATLAWYLTADGWLVEFVFLRTLTRLEGMPFHTSLPLFAYNRARDMLITEAVVVALKQEREEGPAGPRPTEHRLHCEFPDLERLASLLERMACRGENVSGAKTGDGPPSRRLPC